jgi:hypothetical protein
MAMIFFSSPATLTGLEEKKTGPSRFIADFFRLFLDRINKFFKIENLCRQAQALDFQIFTPHPNPPPVWRGEGVGRELRQWARIKEEKIGAARCRDAG